MMVKSRRPGRDGQREYGGLIDGDASLMPSLDQEKDGTDKRVLASKRFRYDRRRIHAKLR